LIYSKAKEYDAREEEYQVFVKGKNIKPIV
jgi:hypothetical protein